MKLSLVFMTGRADPRLDWVIDALEQTAQHDDDIQLIIVDTFGRRAEDIGFRHVAHVTDLIVTSPKPNIWQGIHRITSCEWWATANARNTALAFAAGEYVAFLDDRGRPGPHWLDEIRKGDRDRASVLAGSYDKHENPDGIAKIATDHRREYAPLGKINCGGGWLYGCTFALPLEWALEVNGLEEGCDGLTGEDYIFGLMLGNAGHRIDFVPRMFVSQDRTGDNTSCKGSYACRDKGVSPNDKSHAALERFGKRRRTEFTPDLRVLRSKISRGEGFPIPDPAIDHRDWYDGQLIREMTRA